MNKIIIFFIAIIVTAAVIKLTLNSTNPYDTIGVPVKFLDKNKVQCGYFLKRKNHSPYIIYYLYDGIELYNTDPDSCDKLTRKNDIENIIVIDDNSDFKSAYINTFIDRVDWFEHVLGEAKILKELEK